MKVICEKLSCMYNSKTNILDEPINRTVIGGECTRDNIALSLLPDQYDKTNCLMYKESINRNEVQADI